LKANGTLEGALHHKRKKFHSHNESAAHPKWRHEIHSLSAQSMASEGQSFLSDTSYHSPSSHRNNNSREQSPPADHMHDDADDEDDPMDAFSDSSPSDPSKKHSHHKMRKLFHNENASQLRASSAHKNVRVPQSPELSISLDHSSELPSGMDLSGIHATNSSFQSSTSANTPYNIRHGAQNPSPPHHLHPSRLFPLTGGVGLNFDDSDSDQSFDSDSDNDIQMMHDSTPPKYDHSFNKSFDGEFQRVPCRLTNSIVHDNPFSPERQRRHSTSPRRQSSSSNGSANDSAPSAVVAVPPPSAKKGRPVFSSARKSTDGHTGDGQLLSQLHRAPILQGYFSRYMEDFEEISILGEGSFGKVTKCKNRFDGMYYAVKQTSRLIKGEKHEANVLREVHALATLVDNPYIVRYYSAWIEDNRLFLQTELCEHGNLYTKFSRKEEFSEDQLLDLLRQVASGLHLMHSASLVHLDIKPENIYMSGSSTYKIGDLGLVASCWERDRDLMEGDCRYLSKEVLSEEDIQDLSKVDIFALGISLYELALGVRLPENRQEWQDIRAGKLEPFPRRFSKDFADLVRIMMDIDPAKRPCALQIIHHSLVDRHKPSYEEVYKKNKELEQKLALYQREFENVEESK